MTGELTDIIFHSVQWQLASKEDKKQCFKL